MNRGANLLSFSTLSAVVLVAAGDNDAVEGESIAFEDATREAGLIEPLSSMMGHGAAWGDFDGDGDLDLYAGGFCDRADSEYAPAPGPVANRLLRNLGNGRFEVSVQPAVEFRGRTSGAVFADLDNDGDLELYVANNAKDSGSVEKLQSSARVRRSNLFRNDGGLFTDISAASGACPDSLLPARNVGLLDFDGDGLLDLFLVEDRFRAGEPRSALLQNLGGLRFEDAGRAAHLPDGLFGLGMAAADLNGDRRPDIFVAHSNRLFLSEPGKGYREALELRDVFAHRPLDGEDWPCGAVFGDLDRNDCLDLVVTAHSIPARNRVFMNAGIEDGVPSFREVTAAAGLGDPVPVRCPHVEIQDFDNDGWPDIYTTAAWIGEDEVTPLIYRNGGTRGGIPRFTPPRPLGGTMVYFPAGPSADYDRDGRLDLFLVNWFPGNHSRLLRNTGPQRNWLEVRVSGKRMNRMGIGAQVRLYMAGRGGRSGGLLGFQEVGAGYGYASGQAAVCHFGLGAEEAADVQVTFPDGKSVSRAGVLANRRVGIEEP